MKSLYLFLALSVACAAPEPENRLGDATDLTPTQSALAYGQYCGDHGLPSCAVSQAWSYYNINCPGVQYTNGVSMQQVHNGNGTWTIYFNNPGFLAGPSRVSFNCGPGSGSGSGTAVVPMVTNGSLLYNSSDITTCHLDVTDSGGSVMFSTPVTVSAGNLQYQPHSIYVSEPNGVWTMRVTTPTYPPPACPPGQSGCIGCGWCGNQTWRWTVN